MTELPPHEEECFFITPIGDEGSEIRRQSDQVSKFIVGKAAARLDLQVTRADELSKPGQISHHVILHACKARAVVADLTNSNPNVYYELALRHAVQLPVVLIAHKAQMPKLAFDVSAERVIPYDHNDLDSVEAVKDEVEAQLRSALEGPTTSPVPIALNLNAFTHGNPEQQVLADLSARMDGLARAVNDMSGRLPPPPYAVLQAKFDATDRVVATHTWDTVWPRLGEIKSTATVRETGTDVVAMLHDPPVRITYRTHYSDTDDVRREIVETLQQEAALYRAEHDST